MSELRDGDDLVVPTSSVVGAEFHMHPKPGGLRDRPLGVLCNGKEFSELVLRRVAAAIEAREGPSAIGWWDKGFPAKAAPFLDEVASRSVFVLNGVGH